MNGYELSDMCDIIKAWNKYLSMKNTFELRYFINKEILDIYCNDEYRILEIFQKVSLSNFKKLLTVLKKDKLESLEKVSVIF